MTELTCPNCGAACPVTLRSAKLVTCLSCSTTLMLNGAHVEGAGEQGVMHDAPMLFQIGDTVELGDSPLLILGHARFSYGRGFWDEFCTTDDSGAVIWVSVDEGDVVEQRRIPDGQAPRAQPPFKPGETIEFQRSTYVVSEVEQAECIALRGQFDEALHVGETYDFVNASADGYSLLSAEFWDGGASWYVGRWRDPFGIKVQR